ncbi:MAG: hypothetical protein J07HQW1_01470 [Haloquadratum walsbyi J07HQW1]|uniref:Uncharacterized protein n=1 Tax=Haloquadratum walsbyi J07HQW1 TaxID=1238424 RepID=U1PH10_9EURY|nr:MAG: hypothetical protein J07HQW1_01470 [Haloquadratum walsbyi J07HQW1]
MSVKSMNAITGFSHRLVRYAVERHFESIFLLTLMFAPAPSLHIFLCPTYVAVLEVSTAVLESSPSVVTLATHPEHAR